MPLGASPHVNSSAKIGSCPHGLPMGACPICNGMAGGNSTNKRDIPRNLGEMTYNQCVAAGLAIKAQKAARKRAQVAQNNHLQALLQFNKTLENVHQKILVFAAQISDKMPAIFSKPVNFVLVKIVARFVSLSANLPKNIANLIQKFLDISDKLSAIFGEIKSALLKIRFLNKTNSKKQKSIFFILGADETDDEDKKIDEVKKAFNLKSFIQNLTSKLKGNNQNT